MTRVAVLGSTGSIGRQTLQVIRDLGEPYSVSALAAHRNGTLLGEQTREFRPEAVCLVKGEMPDPPPTRLLRGPDGLVALLEGTGCDLVVNAISGAAGLQVTARAVGLGIDLALANKESLVMAGARIMELARASGSRLIPIDSEHSALSQCLRGGQLDEVRRLVLTASGGPFRGRHRSDLRAVTPAEALRHPTWEMGPKISIDSATLMNKALEVIEAHVLFGVPVAAIEVVIHPESVVHSLVEFHDGSILAHLGAPDMRIPIQYALTHPARVERPGGNFSLLEQGHLHFSEPDHATFPAIALARRVCERGGVAPVVFNAANEWAVAGFLDGRISFLDISDFVARAVEEHTDGSVSDIPEILEVDRRTRERMNAWI